MGRVGWVSSAGRVGSHVHTPQLGTAGLGWPAGLGQRGVKDRPAQKQAEEQQVESDLGEGPITAMRICKTVRFQSSLFFRCQQIPGEILGHQPVPSLEKSISLLRPLLASPYLGAEAR